jgi:hypothetical protein
MFTMNRPGQFTDQAPEGTIEQVRAVREQTRLGHRFTITEAADWAGAAWSRTRRMLDAGEFPNAHRAECPPGESNPHPWPVAAWYEQGRVRHLGPLAELVDQLTTRPAPKAGASSPWMSHSTPPRRRER